MEFVVIFPPYVHFEDFIDFIMNLRGTKWYYFDYIILAYEMLLFYLYNLCANIKKNSLVQEKVGWPDSLYICIWYPNQKEL